MGLQYELPSAVPQSIESRNMRLCCTAGPGERLTHRAQHIQRWSAATPTVLGPQPRLAQLLALQHAQDLSRRGRTAAWCGTLSQLLQMLRCFVDSVQPPRLGQQGAMHQGQQGPLTAQQCSDGCSGRLCAWPCICC
jgi:hypothetical protein